jgi:hypothetical protein
MVLRVKLVTCFKALEVNPTGYNEKNEEMEEVFV